VIWIRAMHGLPDEAASQIATIYAWQGDEEQTLVWLDRAIAIRYRAVGQPGAVLRAHEVGRKAKTLKLRTP
jgi:hypothetical protein